MPSLFEDFGKRFTDAAKAVGRRTQEAADVVKLNGRVTSIQDEIDRLFAQIGKAYYAVRGAGQNEAADTLCAEIDRLQLEQKTLREELDRIRNLKRCPNCGEVQALSAQFCASCGTKMPDPPPPPPQPEREPEPEKEPVNVTSDQPGVTIDWPSAGKAEAGAEAETEDGDKEE